MNESSVLQDDEQHAPTLWILPWHQTCVDAFRAASPEDAVPSPTTRTTSGMKALQDVLTEIGVIAEGWRVDQWGNPIAESGAHPMRFRWMMHHRQVPAEWWELSVDWLCPYCNQALRTFWQSQERPADPTSVWIGRMIVEIRRHGDQWYHDHMELEWCPKAYLQRVPDEARAIVDAIMTFVETVQARKGK